MFDAFMNRRDILRGSIAGLIWGGASMAQADVRAPEVRIHAAVGGRQVPVWTWHPQKPNGLAIVFFSGAFSSPAKYRRLIEPWVRAGYGVFAPLPVDSTDNPDHARYDRPAVWRTRVEDAHIVADLASTYGGGRFLAAGHSYGGLNALALGGAKPAPPPDDPRPMADPRVLAIAAFSPPGAMPGLIDTAGFLSMNKPALVQTGTKDVLPGFIDDYHAHLDAFEAGTGRPLYGLILDDVDHYFGSGICRPELPVPVLEEALAQAVGVSIDLFDAIGLHNVTAHERLDGSPERQGTGRLLRRL